MAKCSSKARSQEAPETPSSVPRYWLITKHENRQIVMFTFAPPGGEKTLPVFSFEEEAEMFLSLGASGTGWRTKETTAGELISVLYGPCASASKVALDPPGIGGEAVVNLLSSSRRRFVCHLVSERKLPAPA